MRREHRLVCSTGAISKPVMALAFGIVFLLVAVLVAALLGHWLWAIVLGATGAVLVARATNAWTQKNRQPTR